VKKERDHGGTNQQSCTAPNPALIKFPQAKAKQQSEDCPGTSQEN
jgi:hypothetical protein